MVQKAAIVLAGGKGERFQSTPHMWQDKALAPLFGKPLIVHAIENVLPAVDEVVVCVNDQNRQTKYAEILKEYGLTNVRLLVDEKLDNLGGPLVAIFTGLKFLNAEYCFTLPGDMPMVQPKIVDYMFEKAKDAFVVVPMWPNGRLETLTMVLERQNTLQIAQTLCQIGRPRSDDIVRGTSNVTFLSTTGEISRLDPDFKSFVNINSPEDLTRLQPRRVQGTSTKNLHVERGIFPADELVRMREAANLLRDTKFLEASEIFASCADDLENKNLLFWAALNRENQGKSLMKLYKAQNAPNIATEKASVLRVAFLKAATIYEQEAKEHEKCRCFFLADRARSDKVWCEARAMALQ